MGRVFWHCPWTKTGLATPGITTWEVVKDSSLVPSPKLTCSSESAQDPVCSEKFLDDSEEQPGLTTVKEVFEDTRCFSPER